MLYIIFLSVLEVEWKLLVEEEVVGLVNYYQVVDLVFVCVDFENIRVEFEMFEVVVFEFLIVVGERDVILLFLELVFKQF